MKTRAVNDLSQFSVDEITMIEKIKGCLLGCAVGDALGAPVEFMDVGEIRSKFGPEGLTGYSPAYGRLGAITDDTQMTLWTAEGLIRAIARYEERGICNPISVIHSAYRRWLYTQRTTIETIDRDNKWRLTGWLLSQRVLHARRAPGNTCLSALQSEKMGEIATPLNNSKGCGGVMRVAPIGLVVNEPFRMGAEVAALTHGHPSGYLSAGAYAHIINGISTKGLRISDAAKAAITELKKWQGHEETLHAMEKALQLAKSAPRTPETIESLGRGWTGEEALAIALFCALTAMDFRSGVLLSVNHSGDSDTTGSMTGSLLGTLLGAKAIPGEFLKNLEARELIEEIAGDFEVYFCDKAHDIWPEKYPPN